MCNKMYENVKSSDYTKKSLQSDSIPATMEVVTRTNAVKSLSDMTMTKLLSCRYNMDTNRVETRFEDGTTLSIDCIAIEDEYGNTPAQRAELDWLLYNNPLEYARMVLSGEIEHYLTLGCDHGKLKD